MFGFIDVPVVHFSVTWWKTQHPGSVIVRDALPPEMLATFLFTMACTIVLAAVLIAIRYRIETLADGQVAHVAELAPVGTPREPKPTRGSTSPPHVRSRQWGWAGAGPGR